MFGEEIVTVEAGTFEGVGLHDAGGILHLRGDVDGDVAAFGMAGEDDGLIGAIEDLLGEL